MSVNPTDFVGLHNHSDYSLFDSISKYSDMITKTKEMGMDALGISEHGTTSGLLDFYRQCTNAGIKPILGCEFYISTNINVRDRDNTYHICLFAKDFEGYKNLNKLNSFAQEHLYYKPRISFAKLREYSRGLICTSACMGGLLNSDEADEYVVLLQGIFGEDFYIEFQFNTLITQFNYNEKLMILSQKYCIEPICTIDSHYINKEDAVVHRLWKGIRDNNDFFSTDDFYLYDGTEMLARGSTQFLPSDVTRMINNTRVIADKCNCVIEKEDKNYPVFPVENQYSYLCGLVQEGAKHKLTAPFSQEYTSRIKNELWMIGKADYTNYFLIMYDLCSWADNVSHIRRGIGRGSVVASLVSYLLNITGLDSIKYNLLFERFLHLERVTPCDIDLDFQSSRRDEVIDYLRDKYGYAYNVRTFNLMGAPASIQRAGQALGFDPQEMIRLSKKTDSLSDMPEIYDGKVLTQKQYNDLKWLAGKFFGLIQSFGKHASAIMVFPKEIENWCAIEVQDGTPVVNTDFHILEDHCGLLKLDILGIQTLDVVQGAVDLIKEEGKDFPYDLNNLPTLDEKTFKMLQRGFTCGCFQLESGGMTNLVMNLAPSAFEDLIPLVALYRPGCLKAGMTDMFVDRKTAKAKVEYIHPNLEPVMRDTYGVMLFQEQVMQMVQVMAGYSLGQADLFRRAIGRKDIKLMNEILPPFIKACEVNGYSHADSQKVADYIYGCSDYLFNKGHSAGYGYISYQTAFIKANYPLEYMCSLLNVYSKDKDSQTVYMNHCKKIGIKLLPPLIDRCKPEWSISDGALVVGLNAIKNVGSAILDKSESDFDKFIINNIGVSKRVLEYLIKAGCFEGNRGQLLAKLEWYKDEKKGYKRKLFCRAKFDEMTMSGHSDRALNWERKSLDVPNFDNSVVYPEERAVWEIEALGFTFYDLLDDYNLLLCDYYSDLVGCVIEKIKPWKTKGGNPMAFFKARSKYGTLDYVIFSDKYNMLEVGGVFIIKISKGNIVSDIERAKKK